VADRIADRLADPQFGEWMDANQAARYLGVSRRAVYDYAQRLGLPCHQDGGHAKLWFKRSELDAWRGRQ
jgi:excisionase family DNA binding protein